MSTASLAHSPALFTLHRAHLDGTTEPVEGTETTDRITGIETGHRLTREHPGAAFTLFEGSTPRDRFGHKALKLKLRPDAIAMIVAL